MSTEVPNGPSRSVAELVSDLSAQTSRLVRTEAELALREMTGKARRAAAGAGAFGVAAVLAGYAGMALLACLILALATAMPAWVAALVVGCGLLLLAATAALLARSRLRGAMPPVPRSSIASLREDIAAVRRPERA